MLSVRPVGCCSDARGVSDEQKTYSMIAIVIADHETASAITKVSARSASSEGNQRGVRESPLRRRVIERVAAARVSLAAPKSDEAMR
jgi:hypothetical protein